MPKRTDIHSILIIGAGPIVIGQGCEFDYSGTQACKALKEEGYKVILVNSNPATIMTDPEMADRTYIEPITVEAVTKIIEKERPDALLPTLGGQTGLNTAMALFDAGVLTKYNVKMIGANREAIRRGEDRSVFKELMGKIGLECPKSGLAHSMAEAREVVKFTGLPCIIRASFTLGGTGSGIAYNMEEFETLAQRGLDASMITEIQIDQSLIGWKEYELEVMRDTADNVVIVCSIENFDPMGVHTGDSITVAPAQTLTDKEYQRMRDASIAIIRAVGVETGGSNIQFGVKPTTGEIVVIEMNPRVSRSSALASKATGFPIAKLAAKLAVGYTLDELPNDITKKTVACFEPSIDYVVVKIPRWTFEKFPDADETLTTQMKSVGEAMSIGRTFKEALQKGIRSMEVKRFGLGLDKIDKWWKSIALHGNAGPMGASSANTTEKPAKSLGDRGSDMTRVKASEEAAETWPIPEEKLNRKLSIPSQGRMYYIRYALKSGYSIDRIYQLTKIDKWFLEQIKQLVDFEKTLADEREYVRRASGIGNAADDRKPSDQLAAVLRQAKEWGYSDVQLATVWGATPLQIRELRKRYGIQPVYKLVDTCAAEFEAATPYYYSTYESPIKTLVPRPSGSAPQPSDSKGAPSITESYDDEIRVTSKKKIIILGGGPNRIGQGIEFDYCCVQAAFAAKELGFESVMVNSNPETVSTDYDTSDLLFFEPLTQEDVLNIVERLNGKPLQAQRHKGTEAQREGTSPNAPAPLSASVPQSLSAPNSPLTALTANPDGNVAGVIVQFGGQTPLNLARGLKDYGVPIIGTAVESIEAAEDRKLFNEMIKKLGLKQPNGGTARSAEEARIVAKQIGYPVLVRPSFVLGGRAMEIVSNEDQLNYYIQNAVEVADEHPVLIDSFLGDATEMDVDCIGDGENFIVCGLMEHIEEAGIHSGDSACSLPPFSLPKNILDEVRRNTLMLAKELKVRGLMNVQFAIKDGSVYILEVNPRASRTVPFVSKATGVSWARIAAKVMMGKTLKELGITGEIIPTGHVAVKESVFPFNKFPGVDVILGPEMRSTGEVMGLDANFPLAFAKSQMAAGGSLPLEGTIYVSVRNADKPAIVPIARKLAELGFNLLATGGTHKALADAGIASERVNKIKEGRPNIIDAIKDKRVALLINTPTTKGPRTDEGQIRAAAVMHKIPIITTLTAAHAAADAIEALKSAAVGQPSWSVKPLQDYYRV
ncbi:MAG TPA: carbamoyl-phosphate synthase large subunit [Phycisphaerae bacterium]|nr:carbamoyl-phosphate synthase large subunit [Phycisphaerae bacterium]